MQTELDCVLALRNKVQLEEFKENLKNIGGSTYFDFKVRVDLNNVRNAKETGLLKAIKLVINEDGGTLTSDSGI